MAESTAELSAAVVIVVGAWQGELREAQREAVMGAKQAATWVASGEGGKAVEMEATLVEVVGKEVRMEEAGLVA